MSINDNLDAYIPGKGISFSKLVSIVKSGGSVFANNKHNASIVARAAGNGRKPILHPAHGTGRSGGYYRHYHARVEGVNGKGKGHVFFSMVSLSYTDLEMHQYRMILYAVKKSDLFSLITYQKKPYSKIPPNCEHDDILEIIKDSLVTQLVGIRKWSGSGENNNHVVMNVYKCDRATRMFLLGKMDLLKYSNTFPEDLCFYRGRKAWFSITTHEEYAAIYSETKEDLSFLNSCGISWSFQGDIRPYLLPELL